MVCGRGVAHINTKTKCLSLGSHSKTLINEKRYEDGHIARSINYVFTTGYLGLM